MSALLQSKNTAGFDYFIQFDGTVCKLSKTTRVKNLDKNIIKFINNYNLLSILMHDKVASFLFCA